MQSNVPAARLPLVGRAADLDALVEQVRAAPGRVLTIAGPGGIGKTSLALAVARRVTPSFAHGVWFADLSAVTAPDAILPAIASAVGVREGLDLPVADALRTFLNGR